MRRNISLLCGLLFGVASFLSLSAGQDYSKELRWCTIGNAEYRKCLAWSEWIAQNVHDTSALQIKRLSCVEAVDSFDCVSKIQNLEADLITMEPGMAYYAQLLNDFVPIYREVYDPRFGWKSQGGHHGYYSVMVVRANSGITSVSGLRGKSLCSSGALSAAGWILPLGKMIEDNELTVTDCSTSVKNAMTYFTGGMCAPNALSQMFNEYGDNPPQACAKCHFPSECNSNDPLAGFSGAIHCLWQGAGDVALVKESSAELFADGNSSISNQLRLLCPTGGVKPISEWETCNWGKSGPNYVMASEFETRVVEFQRFLDHVLSALKSANTLGNSTFDLFSSKGYDIEFGRDNLIFSDDAIDIQRVQSSILSEEWLGPDFEQRLRLLNACPLRPARWCVISSRELAKCETMMEVFKGRRLHPDLDCVLGTGTEDCIQKVAQGDADLITLDAGDMYMAGKKYGLVPFAAEDYGDNTASYYVVAVTRISNQNSTLFNLKNKMTCHSAAGFASGWYIPLAVFVQSGMIRVDDCDAAMAMGQFFLRNCIPGVLNIRFNPQNTNPIDLCESCASGGENHCQRDSRELFYGTTGAFRCLVEGGGDVAFVRHTTVRENTDGRNPSYWARNRRSKDYQLLCRDGKRASPANWQDCYLAQIPGAAVATASFKSPTERLTYWKLLDYAQNYFASDVAADFNMFDSGFDDQDLLFSDATVRLSYIESHQQDYQAWLGPRFLSVISNLANYDCQNSPASRLSSSSSSSMPLWLVMSSVALLLRHALVR